MAKRKMDDEDSLKRQARRRLIGAVALVTAVVVVLPMVLDSEPRIAGQNIDLRIPDPDKVGEFKSQIVLPAESAPVETPAPVATSTATIPPAAPAAKAESKSQPTAAKSAKTVPVAKAESKAAEKQHVVPKQGFAVQVGAYSSATAAKQLETKFNKQGFHTYTEKTGSNVRVRIGPYATRQAAEQDMHKLETQGMHPVLITLN